MAKISVNAESAITSVKTLIKEIERLNTSMSKVGKANATAFTSLKSDINSLQRAIKTMSKRFTALNSELKRNSSITKTNSKRLTVNSNTIKRNADLTKTNSRNKRANTRAINKNTTALNKHTNANNRNTASKKKAKKASAGFFASMQKGIGTIMAAIAAFSIFIGIAKNIFNLAISFDSLKLALEFTSRATWEAGRSMQFLLTLNQKFGAQISVTAERWLKFRTAARLSGLTMLETKAIFQSVTKASALLGLKTDELKGIYLALEQMLNKGKVTTEELRRQLGERLPGAVGIMAASMGVGLEELDKMMKKGEVLSAEVLPNFAKQLEIAYGIDKREKIENMQTAVNKLKGAWDSLILTIVEGDGVFSKTVKAITDTLTGLFNSLNMAFGDDEQTVRMLQGRFNKEMMDKYEEDAENLMGTQMQKRRRQMAFVDKLNKDLVKKQKEISAELNEIKRNELKEEYNIIEDNINLRMAQVVKIDKEKARIKHILAVANLKQDEQDVEDAKAVVEKEGSLNLTALAKALEYLKTVRQGLNPAGIIAEAVFGQTSEEQFDNFFNNLSGGMQDLIKKAEQLAVTQELAEPGGINRKFDDDSETDKSKKTAKKAKDYILSLEKAILLTKQQIKVNKILLDNELTGSIVRETALKNLIEDRKALVKLEMIQAGIKAKEKMTNELATWEKSNSRFDDVEEGDVNYSVKLEQLANFKIAQKNISKKYNDELEAIEQTYQNKLLDIDNDKGVIQINNARALGKIELDQIKLDNQEKVVAIDNRRKKIAEGSKEDIILQQELLVLKTELANAEIDNQIRILKAIQEVQRANKNFDAVDSIQKQIKALGGMKQDPGSIRPKEDLEYWAKKGQEVMNAIGDLGDAVFERRIDNIQKEIDAETEKYDRLLELAKDDEEETKIIERNKALRLEELEKKKKKEQVKQAKFQKALAVQNAIINTSLAVSSALTAGPGTGIALAVITAAIGALEIATILATPIPSFATGGIMGHDGLALINDGGNKEYIERNGSILSTDNPNAFVNLQKGDIIHKDYDDMMKKSMLMNLYTGGAIIENDANYDGIEKAIDKGFKRAKINNNVSVLNQQNSYKEQSSTWN
jgi:tape measure domain-containing protein